MKLKDLIREKGFEVIAVDGETTIEEATLKMVDRNIGALLIVEGGKTVGMFTERDVLKSLVAGKDLKSTTLHDVMTTDLIIAEVTDELEYAMSIMIQRRVRHLPVLDSGKLVSVLSIRDVVKAQVKNLQAEVHYLKDFISDIG